MAELCLLLAPQPEQAKAARALQVLVGQEVKLLLQLLRAEILRDRDLASAGHLWSERDARR